MISAGSYAKAVGARKTRRDDASSCLREKRAPSPAGAPAKAGGEQDAGPWGSVRRTSSAGPCPRPLPTNIPASGGSEPWNSQSFRQPLGAGLCLAALIRGLGLRRGCRAPCFFAWPRIGTSCAEVDGHRRVSPSLFICLPLCSRSQLQL